MGEGQTRFRSRARLGLDDDGIHAETSSAGIAPEGNSPAGKGARKKTESRIRRHQIHAGIRKDAQHEGFRVIRISWAT